MDSNAPGPSLTLDEASPLFTAFTTFLTITIHTLLYHRNLYPPTTFAPVRAYNLPIHQSRHPGVCAWINDAVSAIATQLRSGGVERIAMAVHAEDSLDVLERWVFDVARFPTWGNAVAKGKLGKGNHSGRQGKGKEREGGGGGGGGGSEEDDVNMVDVNESLRGALRRIAYAGEKMKPLPAGCSFTLAVELRDKALAPISHPQQWIPSEPHLQPPTQQYPDVGSAIGGEETTPVRSVRAGPLFFECWVEHGSTSTPAQATQSSQQSEAMQPS